MAGSAKNVEKLTVGYTILYNFFKFVNVFLTLFRD